MREKIMLYRLLEQWQKKAEFGNRVGYELGVTLGIPSDLKANRYRFGLIKIYSVT